MRGKADDTDRALGAEIRRLRKRLGLSQDELAAQLNISRQQFGKYEKGHSRWPAGAYERLSEYLNAYPQRSGFAEAAAFPLTSNTISSRELAAALIRIRSEIDDILDRLGTSGPTGETRADPLPEGPTRD